MKKEDLIKYLGVGLGGALLTYLILKPKLAAAYQLPGLPQPQPGVPQYVPPSYPSPYYPYSPYYPETKWGFFSELSKSLADVLKAIVGRKETQAPGTYAGYLAPKPVYKDVIYI